MDIIRICQSYKNYLNKPEVKAVCESKIYNGLRKVEAGFRTYLSAKSIDTQDLDKFYSKAPASVKMFKSSMITQAMSNFDYNLSGAQDSVKALDVYNKALYFLTIAKLTKFWVSVVTDNPNASIDTTGVSKTVFARAKSVEDIINLSEADLKLKNPDKASLRYIEMGLKRIISMEVGSDDWDK